MPEISESDLNRAIAAGECRIKIDPQAGDESFLDCAVAERRHVLQALLRRAEVARQEFALGAVQLDLEGELVAPVPAVVRQQLPAEDQISKCHSVRRRCLGALSSEQVERGQLFALLPGSYQDGAAVELIDDVKDALFALLGRCVLEEQPSDSKMLFGPRFFRDQRIGSLVDAVVYESVGAVETLDEPVAHRLPEIAVNVLFRCALNEQERRRRRCVSKASESRMPSSA